MTGFENFGKQGNVEDDAKMECGVCWQVYDPAEGPEDWRCPNCDAAQARFMRLEDKRLDDSRSGENG
jgi:rubredoxin